MANEDKYALSDFNFVKNKVAKHFIATATSSFSIFYIFGALLLWQYLDVQGLRGEFSFLIASNNLLISFALLGMFAASIIVFYLFYAQSLLKSVMHDSSALSNKKSRRSFLCLHLIGYGLIIMNALTWA